MSKTRVGILGFGEVGRTFARAIRASGAPVAVFDTLLLQEGGEAMMRERIGEQDVQLCTLEELLAGSDYVLSTVTTDVALDAAERAAHFLGPGKTYVDLNSSAPTVKAAIADVVERMGASCVEGAILEPIGAKGAAVQILLAGERAGTTAEVLTSVGLNARRFADEVGKASMFKMVRSIFSKGLECLMLEMMVAARRAGIEDEIWSDVTQFVDRNPFEKVASTWISTHATACERRYHEMQQVVETADDLGLNPLMATAARDFFERSLPLALRRSIDDAPTADQVIQRLDESL